MKATRQKAILEIIRQQDINTQEELAEALKKLNFNVTQATVSRDIKELRLLKTLSSEGVYRYTMVENVERYAGRTVPPYLQRIGIIGIRLRITRW